MELTSKKTHDKACVDPEKSMSAARKFASADKAFVTNISTWDRRVSYFESAVEKRFEEVRLDDTDKPSHFPVEIEDEFKRLGWCAYDGQREWWASHVGCTTYLTRSFELSVILALFSASHEKESVPDFINECMAGNWTRAIGTLRQSTLRIEHGYSHNHSITAQCQSAPSATNPECEGGNPLLGYPATEWMGPYNYSLASFYGTPTMSPSFCHMILHIIHLHKTEKWLPVNGTTQQRRRPEFRLQEPILQDTNFAYEIKASYRGKKRLELLLSIVSLTGAKKRAPSQWGSISYNFIKLRNGIGVTKHGYNRSCIRGIAQIEPLVRLHLDRATHPLSVCQVSSDAYLVLQGCPNVDESALLLGDDCTDGILDTLFDESGDSAGDCVDDNAEDGAKRMRTAAV